MMKYVQLELGKVNGCPVLSRHQVQREGWQHLQVVLCYEPEDDCYVCWIHNVQSGGYGNGEYFPPGTPYAAALRFYVGRILREEGVAA